MKKSTLMIGALAGFIVMNHSGVASAQMLLDQALSSSVGAATEMGASAHTAVDTNTVMQRLQQQGYSNVAPSSTNAGQYTATTAEGISVLLTVEPLTGKILGAAPQ